MVYCTLEEAWGTNFVSENKKNRRRNRRNKRRNIKNKNMYSPELDETVVLNGKYSDKNEFTRDVHSHLTRQPRVEPINVSIGDNHVEYMNNNDTANIENVPGMPQYQLSDNGPEYADLDTTSTSNAQFNNNNVQFNNNNEIIPYEESYNVSPLDNLDSNFQLYNGSDDGNNGNYGNGGNDGNDGVENGNFMSQNIRMEISEKDRYQTLESKIDMILEKVMRLERQINIEKESGSDNIHDIILFVMFGIFIIFIMDSIYRVGKSTI